MKYFIEKQMESWVNQRGIIGVIKEFASLVMKSVAVLLLVPVAMAAIPGQKSAPLKILSAPAAVVGGVAGDGFSLLDIKKEILAAGSIERLIIEVGDYRGRPNLGPTAYYHAQLMKDPSRLVIDFSQMTLSLIDQKQLSERLQNSKFVHRVQMTKDSSDQTISMIFDLKVNTRARVIQVKGMKKTSKLVVDFL